MIAPFVTSKRPIISVSVNGKPAYMLVDTGASVGLIDVNARKLYGFDCGLPYAGSVTGVGGDVGVWHTKKLAVDIVGVPLVQFLTSDIMSVADSIQRETGIRISGIIGWKQINGAEMKIMEDKVIIGE